MAKPKNVNLDSYKDMFSSGKQHLQNVVEKIRLSRRTQRSRNNREIFDPLSTRYRISTDRLRLPK
ncbi:MAG: hypothetical protein ACFFAE_05545 [Candidatus Hodarchaeota archaeon]